MAYEVLAKDGRPVKRDGNPVMAMDVTISKIDQLDELNKSFVAVASTEDEDRDKDIIRQNGWDLKNFKKNPMIPWMHDYWGVPVARSIRTWVDRNKKRLLFKPQFDENDDTSMKIFNKYKNGFLTSFSVGFRGIEANPRDEHDAWFGGREFIKQELLEISAVTIPANPNATVNVNSEVAGQNLLQLGYPQVFAKTEYGLFYPVREMGEYTDPKTEKLEKGISKLLATPLDDENEQITVGYIFTPEWEFGDAAKYVHTNEPMKYKHYYYDFKSTDDGYEIKQVEEERDVPVFLEPVGVDVTTTSEKDGEEDPDIYADDSANDDQTETKTEETETDKTNDENTFDAFFLQFKEIIDTLVDNIDERLNCIADKIEESLAEIKSFVKEKNVENDLEITDNEDAETKDDSTSKDNDIIEFDDTSFTPDGDKQTDDDIIELEDDIVADGKMVKTVFSEVLKETLKKATKDALKIDL
jgi:HK97 family phage prohead protease